MTTLQRIAELTKKLGLGHRDTDGIKHVLGKVPVNYSEPRMQRVLETLQAEWDVSDDNQDDAASASAWGEDAPIRFPNAINR